MSEILDQQRQIIDDIDQEIIKLLARRFEAACIIGREKQQIGKDVFDTNREQSVLDDRAGVAEDEGLNPDFVRNLMQMIMDEAKAVQRDMSLS
ncbi:hypothetical protein CR969_02030 [Candidatus Saccharibacteria bacterium]|nr:MAG: hypothetical protein CR969_02030 [Candidatus Saccharibacteria bacterium]